MGKDGVFFKLLVQLSLCINNVMFAGIFFFKMHVTCLFKTAEYVGLHLNKHYSIFYYIKLRSALCLDFFMYVEYVFD